MAPSLGLVPPSTSRLTGLLPDPFTAFPRSEQWACAYFPHGRRAALRVLGPLRLERDGQDIDIGGARQREVLARLAVAGGQPVTAESLHRRRLGSLSRQTPPPSSLHVSVSKLQARRSTRTAAPARVLPAGQHGGGLRLGCRFRRGRSRRTCASCCALLLDARAISTAAHAVLDDARALWRGEPYEEVGEHAWLVLERRCCDELRKLRRGAVRRDHAPARAATPAAWCWT